MSFNPYSTIKGDVNTYTGDPVALTADFMDSVSSSLSDRNELAADLKLKESI